MARRESYVRVMARAGDVEIVAGLEFREDDSYPLVLGALQHHTDAVARAAPRAPAVHDYEIAKRVEEFCARWPHRRYFVEVSSDPEQRGWIQLFQPHGVPHDMRAELANLAAIVRELARDVTVNPARQLAIAALCARLEAA